MHVRLATVDDIPTMHRIRLAVRENVLRDATRVRFADYRRLLESDGRGWIAELDGAAAGFAVADRMHSNVWALFVDPRYERRGLGRALHEALLDWLFETGDEDVWLSTEPGSRAERFYRIAGWQPTGTLPNGEQRFEMTAGRWRDVRAAISGTPRQIAPQG